jgi:hypothetical protein
MFRITSLLATPAKMVRFRCARIRYHQIVVDIISRATGFDIERARRLVKDTKRPEWDDIQGDLRSFLGENLFISSMDLNKACAALLEFKN